MGDSEAATPVVRPPVLRETPCECGELPLLVDGYYVCTNPACDGYGQVCSAAR